MAFGSASSELWALTQAERQQLRADHEAAAALGRKLGLQSCKELREEKVVQFYSNGLVADDLALLGTLGSVLPALRLRQRPQLAAGAAEGHGDARVEHVAQLDEDYALRFL